MFITTTTTTTTTATTTTIISCEVLGVVPVLYPSK
jgi:hypothetical protein